MSGDEPARDEALPPGRRDTRRRAVVTLLLCALLAAWLLTAYWQTVKPLPPGTDLASPWYPARDSSVRFLADVRAADAYGRPLPSEVIYAQTLEVVRNARDFIVLDSRLSAELADELIARRRAEPGLRVLLITDPASVWHGRSPRADLRRLRTAGVEVVTADLDRLRDSNFLYSSLWRIALSWWGDDSRIGAWARFINFKSDHRRLIVADDGRGGLVGIVSSANAVRGDAAPSSVALEVRGPVLDRLLASEIAVARFSGWSGVLRVRGAASAQTLSEQTRPPGLGTGPVAVRLLTEGAIREALLERIGAAGRGDSIDAAVFAISDRAIIEALLAASSRGATVRLILDPGAEDADSGGAAGVPNRPASSELVAASDGAISVRWFRTHGERFRDALVLVYGPERVWLTLGSASLTRRDLENYDLEADLAANAARSSDLAAETIGYFETLWSNRAPPGVELTADVGVYADASQLDYWWYRFTEATGLASY
ncbi:MAG TPA: phospholipase D-like domain-containing protein [Steroidobacteraceae bacterium]|nr:phospholipase D-like domain-containing protein [Steroidobacteraceae bacterium]